MPRNRIRNGSATTRTNAGTNLNRGNDARDVGASASSSRSRRRPKPTPTAASARVPLDSVDRTGAGNTNASVTGFDSHPTSPAPGGDSAGAVTTPGVMAAHALRVQQHNGLSPETLNALVEARHADPHTILGPHEVQRIGGEATEVRAYFPNAASVTLVVDRDNQPEKIPMSLVHQHGVFNAEFKGPRWLNYHFEVTPKDSNDVRTVQDPYRFPVTIEKSQLDAFNTGKLLEVASMQGAQRETIEGVDGFRFAIWAPNAKRVTVLGEFNDWSTQQNPMRKLGDSGVWEIFIPGAKPGQGYKFEVADVNGKSLLHTDPYGKSRALRPGNQSILVDSANFQWSDDAWMQARATRDPMRTPLSVYEVHLSSWQRDADGEFLSWDELADKLIPYLKDKGYNAIEMMGLMEHALDDSWGYLVTGFYAPTSRHGGPDGLKRFVEKCHQEGINVIFDWVPGHFPEQNPEALYNLDGTHLYSHEDDRIGLHKDWGARAFNFGRPEVKNFLVGNLHYWLKEFHLDGFRVDAVSAMLYRDYGRKDGEWIPNPDGTNMNNEAIDFLRASTRMAREEFPGVMSFAEESTIYQGITKRPEESATGLGFDFKWNMGWMHDTLNWFKCPHEHRGQAMDGLTNTLLWRNSENFTLSISHDEVVYGKKSLLEKMPGDDWQKFANLRLFLGYMWSYPGHKLLFMGQEFGQRNEWDFKKGIDLALANNSPMHKGIATLMQDLNRLYQSEPALFEKQYDGDGLDLRVRDTDNAVIGMEMRAQDPKERVLFVHNATPTPQNTYRIGVDAPGEYVELLNTDDTKYGGSGVTNGTVKADDVPMHGKPYSIEIRLPPLGSLAMKRKAGS